MAITAYQLISASSAKDLATQVTAALGNNYQPLDVPFVDARGFFCQAVAKGIPGVATTYSAIFATTVPDLNTQVTASIGAGKQPVGRPLLAGAGFVQAMVDGAGVNSSTVYTDYLDAVSGAAYHMEIDLEGVTAGLMPDLTFVDTANPTAGELTALYTRANALQTAIASHMAGVGTRTAMGEHKAAETSVATTLAAVPVASSVGSACTLAIALGVAVIAHGNSSGVHFHDDTSANGSAYAVTSDLLAGNATANKCRIEVNALRAAMTGHFSNGVA